MMAASIIVVESNLEWQLLIISAQFSFRQSDWLKKWVWGIFDGLAFVHKKVFILSFPKDPEEGIYFAEKTQKRRRLW